MCLIEGMTDEQLHRKIRLKSKLLFKGYAYHTCFTGDMASYAMECELNALEDEIDLLWKEIAKRKTTHVCNSNTQKLIEKWKGVSNQC